MLNFKNFLIEGGGNIKVKNIINSGKDQPDEIASNPIDLKSTPRSQVQGDVAGFLHGLNTAHISTTGHNLFGKNGEAINSGAAFAGSTHHLFDPSISDEEHNKHKPSVGDIDTMFRGENKESLANLLTPGAKYGPYTVVGTKKHGSQMSAIAQHDNGQYHQIDFEPASYEGDTPSQWNQFSHSSDWGDVQKGIKGSQHKYLLRALTSAHGSVGSIRKKAGDQEGFLENDTFSVDKGLRPRYQNIGTDENDKPIVKEISPKDATYTTDVPTIYQRLIGKPPSGDDLQKFGSFQGLSELINKHLSPEQRSRVFDKYSSLLYGKGSQKLDQDPIKDSLVKETALNHLRKSFPDHFTSQKEAEIENSRNEFYQGSVPVQQQEPQAPQPEQKIRDGMYGGKKI